jgi:hypothetical protein
MATNGQIQSLETLCSKIQLEVPEFQRNYSWQAEQIGEFHSDIQNAIKKKSSHFIGSTILMSKKHSNNTNVYLIIDGQQRFTTIFMYVAIIRDLVKTFPQNVQVITDEFLSVNVADEATKFLFKKEQNEWIPKFKSNSFLEDFFFQHVLAQVDRREMPRNHKPWSIDLRNGYRYIRNLLQEEINQFAHDYEKVKFLNEFLETIFDLSILSIYTEEYPESFDIFMTLNNRGMSLGPSDLVKSLFMKHGVDGLTDPAVIETVNEKIQEDWKTLTENLGDGNESADPDTFLRHYLVSELPDPVQAKRIFTEIGNIILSKYKPDSVSELKPKIEARKLLDRLIQKSLIYAQINDPLVKIRDSEIRTKVHKMIFLFDTIKIVLLKIMDPEINLTDTQRKELVRICETLSLRWLIVNGNAQQLENIFQNACAELRKENLHYAEVIKILTERIPSDAAVKPQFYAEINKPKLVKVILHTINSAIYDRSELVVFDPKKVQLEHIVPQNPEKWVNDLFLGTPTNLKEPKYKSLCENWGNKTILDFKINASVKDEKFEVKKNGIVKPNGNQEPGYKNSQLKITADIANFSTWTEREVELRNQWIGETFTKIWSLSEGTQNIDAFSEWIKNPPASIN